jgi:hypothetical protein
MKTNIWNIKKPVAEICIVSATLIVTLLGFNGCADYASVSVASGYNDAYYVPDYRPFYVGYVYDGAPWWGPNYTYVKKKIVYKDVDKHVNVNRNIYYGGHHFARDWRGGHFAAGAAVRRSRR